jgi:hypothetical protein
MKTFNGQRCQIFRSKIKCDFYKICRPAKDCYSFMSLLALEQLFMKGRTVKAAV